MRPRTTALALLVMCSKCLTIRVPTVWNSDSEVQNEQSTQETSGNLHQQQKPIPVEYFQYTAKKPQFAAEVAAFHGVPSPDSHYKAYPIRPYTAIEKPQYGQHKLLNENQPVYQNFQDFTNHNEGFKEAIPVSSNYEIFHPYKAEEPGLQALYKDPVLNKIRNDIRSSQYRLQNYEKEAGKPDITEDEYLESPEQTDRKKFPHRNVPAQFEIHRPQRRPVYYRPPPKYTHDYILDHRFRHPFNQHNAKIRPLHYRPLRNHLQNLRQNHALKYEDERNEYPQLSPPESYSEPVDGYDIYERGKDKYIQLRNNVDESINNAIKENRPTIHQKFELQNNDDKIVTEIGQEDDEEVHEEEFVPIKNYAQVRKTETVKHLPRESAFEDAASFDEIRNAPRLREAVKSTKAQTVYTEEGYEDAAYDHAGEQKHASENEAHAGFLKEKEISGGKFKTPSVSAKYEDSNGSAYRDQTLHGEKWKNDDKDNEQEDDEEDFSEDETEKSVEAEVYEEVTGERNKREDIPVRDKSNETNLEHEVNKRETKFKIPEINLNSTFLNEPEILEIAKIILEPRKDNIKEKYPYYFKNLKQIHRDSPLRYSENLKLIPKKSSGGTEFYDSRSMFQCSEVEDNIDPLPDKLKKRGHPDSDEDEVNGEEDNIQKKKGEADFDHLKEKPRLKGLGDKIDCFKAKFFGENPLDSPFFNEEIIANPEPLKVPEFPFFNTKPKEISLESNHNIVFKKSEELRKDSETDIFTLLDKLNNDQKNLQESLIKTNNKLRASLLTPQNISNIQSTELAQQSNVYSDILGNIKNNLQTPTLPNDNSKVSSQLIRPNENTESNVTYNFYQNKEDVTKQPTLFRKKRSTPFVYEPYKIIRDGQVQESKKTTTTSNISPLIKQLQSSRVVDRVTKANQNIEQPVKRNVATRTYKDIGRQDRTKAPGKENENVDAGFVDVNESTRKGEPKYELRPTNHKSQYMPVENKKAMSVEDYESQTNKSNETTKHPQTNSRQRQRQHTTARPYFDVSKFLPKAGELEKQSASNTFKKVIKTPETVTEPQTAEQKATKIKENSDDEEDYEEYDDYEDEEVTTTTTTPKPSFRRRRIKPTTTTTVKPQEEPPEEEIEPELPKLRLITRFRTSTQAPTSSKPERQETKLEKPKYVIDEDDVIAPKYREKKKKTSQSTLVTDTETYGDGEDDMMKEEVDAMIRVQHNMDEYTPQYERDIEKKNKEKKLHRSSEDVDEDDDDDDNVGEYNDDEDEEDEDEEEYEEEEEHEIEPVVTTPEPIKRTLPRTTEAPVSTTEARSSKLELKPIVTKKKIEIHKELPVNKSSPHVTQFKQDIKEVEIIKEVPSKPPKSAKKPTKNIEALELYKDENLAKDVNRLGGVEIFKEGLDLRNGPRHGGNYRSAKLIELNEDNAPISESLHGANLKVAKDDTEPSQSDTKPVGLGDILPARRLHGGNLKSITDVSRSRNNERSAKLELADSFDKPTSKTGMHGGNLRKEQRRGGHRSAKLTELDDDSKEKDDDDFRSTHGGNSKSYGRGSNGRMHGGNYRSAKLVQAEDEDDQKQLQKIVKENRGNSNGRSSGAVLLNSLAQAVPILATTPGYILDPSKRMYYYVDA